MYTHRGSDLDSQNPSTHQRSDSDLETCWRSTLELPFSSTHRGNELDFQKTRSHNLAHAQLSKHQRSDSDLETYC